MQSTLKIVTGTTSQLKINAILQAFQTLYPNHIISISGLEVDAGVPSAPIGDGIFTGAKQRALALKTTHVQDCLFRRLFPSPSRRKAPMKSDQNLTRPPSSLLVRKCPAILKIVILSACILQWH